MNAAAGSLTVSSIMIKSAACTPWAKQLSQLQLCCLAKLVGMHGFKRLPQETASKKQTCDTIWDPRSGYKHGFNTMEVVALSPRFFNE